MSKYFKSQFWFLDVLHPYFFVFTLFVFEFNSSKSYSNILKLTHTIETDKAKTNVTTFEIKIKHEGFHNFVCFV